MLIAFLLALTAGLGSSFTVEPDRIDEWEPFSLRYLCENSVFLGKVTILKMPTIRVDGLLSTAEVQIDETWLGKLPSEVVSIESGRYFYGIGNTRSPKIGESCILAIHRDTEFGTGELQALRYRSIEFVDAYRQAVADWRKLSHLKGEPRLLAEFDWLVEMLKSEALREEATLELLPGEPISIDGLWDRTRYRRLVPTISAEVWAEIEPTLSAEDSHVGGACWHLWYLSQPETSLAWLRKQADRGELGFVPGKMKFFSPAKGFWSEVCDALPQEQAGPLGHAVFDLAAAISPRDRFTRERSSVDPRAVQAALAELQRVVAALEPPESRAELVVWATVPGLEVLETSPPIALPISLMTSCRDAEFLGFVTVADRRGRPDDDLSYELILQVEETLLGDAGFEEIRAPNAVSPYRSAPPSVEVGDRCLLTIVRKQVHGELECLAILRPLEQEEALREAIKRWKAVPDEGHPDRVQAELAWLTWLLRDPLLYAEALPELLHEVSLLEHSKNEVGRYRPYLASVSSDAFRRMGEHLSPSEGDDPARAWQVWRYVDGPAAHAWLREHAKQAGQGWQDQSEARERFPSLKFWRKVSIFLPKPEQGELLLAVGELQYAVSLWNGQTPDRDAVDRAIASLHQVTDGLIPPLGFAAQALPAADKAEVED